MRKLDLETFVYILNKAADILEQLNAKKNNPDIAELVQELRTIMEILLDEEQDEVQKSVSLLTKIINYIKSKLGA